MFYWSIRTCCKFYIPKPTLTATDYGTTTVVFLHVAYQRRRLQDIDASSSFVTRRHAAFVVAHNRRTRRSTSRRQQMTGASDQSNPPGPDKATDVDDHDTMTTCPRACSCWSQLYVRLYCRFDFRNEKPSRAWRQQKCRWHSCCYVAAWRVSSTIFTRATLC